MRLICGIYELGGGEASEDLLRAMAAQMDVPRLRPSLRVWREGAIGLALLDFSTRGAPASALPEENASVMAADVRLDEPAALARSLGAGPAEPPDMLLLKALESNGSAGLAGVLGDFAFAGWNRRSQTLTCGRDAFGIRPLSYAFDPARRFAFASFPVALHGSGIVPKRIDEDAVARRLVHTAQPEDCLIAGIKRLPPAHILRVSRGGISLSRYWQLDRAAVGTRDCSPEEAARELRRLVDEAVACRLPRGAEIGAHLSGGLDSSAIAVLAARRLRTGGRRLHAYSFLDRQRNDITLEDETAFVQAVVEQEGDLDWTPIRPSAELRTRAARMDPDKMAPLDPDAPENAVCTLAEAQGVSVILSGWGGDEGATFNGRGMLAELFLRGRWRTLARKVREFEKERGWPVPLILYHEVASYLLPPSLIDMAKAIAGRRLQLNRLLPQSLSAAMRRRLAAGGGEALSMRPDGRENRWRLMTSPHIAERAEVWAQTGARHGVAFAFPLLDRRVVEFALSLPSELFVREGIRRKPFRDAMADVLPAVVRRRHQKYQPFPGNIIDIAERKDHLLARIDACARDRLVCRIFDVARLRRHIEAFPPPDRLREEMRGGDNPKEMAAMAATLHALAAAEYLSQHGGGSASASPP